MMLLILCAIGATLAMTLFSFVYSLIIGVVYYIPSMIDKFIFPNNNNSFTKLGAWIIHFSIGVGFAIAWYFIQRMFEIEITFVISVIYGFIAGILGVIGWKIILSLSKIEINFDEKFYFLHILLAHVVFGIVLLMSKIYLPLLFL